MTFKTRLISSFIIFFSMILYNVVFIFTTLNFEINQYVQIAAFLLNAPLAFMTMFAVGFNYQQIVRWMISLSIIMLISAIVYYLILRYDLYSKFDSSAKIQAFLSKYGVFAGLIYIIVQFLQVTIIPLPAAITTVAGVALFGFWKTLLYSTIGIISGSMLAFYLGRKFGIKLMVWLCGKSLYEKYQKFTKGRDKIVLTMMFLFPFFPDDLLCIAAGMTNMTYAQFFIIMLITRPLNILAMEGAFKGISAIPLTGYGIPIWIALISVTLLIVILAFKYSGKIEGFLVKIFEKISEKFKRSSKTNECDGEKYSESKSCYNKNNIMK